MGIVALWATLIVVGCGSIGQSDQYTYSVPGVPKVPSDVRRDVTATLDAFVVAAVERKDLSRAYDLSTSTLRGGMTRSQWLTGSIPVAPYPGRDNHVGRWQPTFIKPDSIGLHVILHPQEGSDVGPQSFNIVVRKVDGRWLVDNIYPEAQFATAGKAATIIAEPDFAPHQQGRTAAAHRQRPAGRAVPGAGRAGADRPGGAGGGRCPPRAPAGSRPGRPGVDLLEAAGRPGYMSETRRSSPMPLVYKRSLRFCSSRAVQSVSPPSPRSTASPDGVYAVTLSIAPA